MSTQAKIARELYGPSLTEVTLGASLSLLLGVVLAAGSLIFTPVKTVRELPKEETRERGDVYFVEGTRDVGKARAWTRKRQVLLEGQAGEITLTEDEINMWIAERSKPEGAAASTIEAGTVNVRIRDGIFQAGSANGKLNTFGYSQPVVLQVRGGFAHRGDAIVFVPTESYLGSLPLHNLPVAETYVVRALQAAVTPPEELLAAWSRLSAVEIEGATLKLTLP